MCSIELPEGAILQPGDNADVEITLYPWPVNADLAPGRTWRIQEGGKLTAIGTVLAVLSDERGSQS